MGITGATWPLIIAFAILAAYTYQSGLRAPALIAFVKDALIYIVVLVAVIYIPIKLGGFGDIFAAADKKFAASPAPTDGIAARRRRRPARLLDAGVRLRAGAVPLPALGHRRARDPQPRHDQAQHGGAAGLQLRARPARAARLHGDRGRRDAARRPTASPTRTPSCRCCSTSMFPRLVRRRRLRRHRHRRARPGRDHVDRRGEPVHAQRLQGVPATATRRPQQEAQVSKLASLVVKAGALSSSILALDPQFSIDLQLIGGVIILQTLPAIVARACTRAGSTAGR